MERVPGLFPETDGLALTWIVPWSEGDLLARFRISIFCSSKCAGGFAGTRISARSGTSNAQRINANANNGVLGDPWAPVHIAEVKTLTLGDNGDFDYSKIIELMLSGDWAPPLLATLGPDEAGGTANWLLVAQAFARGNSKTGGFKSRVVPLSGRAARGLGAKRPELHDLVLRHCRGAQTGHSRCETRRLRGEVYAATVAPWAGADVESCEPPNG